MERIFKRKLYDRLLEWKRSQNGKTAILVEGARRVGKSTLVKQFAKNEYESYILIDFNEASKEVKALFDDLMDMDFIFLQLQSIYHVVLKERKSVIVFDEVQNCPLARQAIKYLVKDGRYDYIETGSLISIKKNTKSITIPSEEERVTLYPMDYEEFRWAMGDTATMPSASHFLRKAIAVGQRPPAENARVPALHACRRHASGCGHLHRDKQSQYGGHDEAQYHPDLSGRFPKA